MSGLRLAFSFRESLDTLFRPAILWGMVKTKKSIAVIQVGEVYRLTKATNTLEFKMGKQFTKAELQKVIDSEVNVTVTNNK